MVNQTSLTAIVLAAVLGTLVLSFLLFLVQLRMEAKRMQREVRAAKARRLRHGKSGKEVAALDIEAEHFHLFLSHGLYISSHPRLPLMPPVCLLASTPCCQCLAGAWTPH